MAIVNDPGHNVARFDYDAGWDTKWDDMKQYGPMSRHVRRVITKLIRPLAFRTVLDVGCGQGSLLLGLMEAFPHIRPHGIDVSSRAIERARRRVPQGQFWELDVVHGRPEGVGAFDLVICSEVLEHLVDDEAAIRNLRRLTGGHLVVTTVQGRMRGFEAGAVGHVRNYARGELASKLRAAGFEIVRSVDWGFPFYSPLYRDLLQMTGARGTTGEFGAGRRALATALYYLFHLNLPAWGDELFVMARPRPHGAADAHAGD